MKGLAPLEDHERPAFHQGITALFPDDDAFHRWEDSLWLGLFMARRLTSVLAERKRVVEDSPAGRIQTFLEKAQGKGAFFKPESLLRDLPLAIRRTCCVRLDGDPAGTGFLVAEDAILTNWHVVRSVLSKPESITFAFDYLRPDGVGERPVVVGAKKVERWRASRKKFLLSAPPEDKPLDYAFIHLDASMPKERGFFELTKVPDLQNGSRVVIVGHPEGKPLAVSFSRANGLHNLEDALAYYDADTLAGSSGSLVLLESQNLLQPALLHAGGESADENFGYHLRAIWEDLQGGVSKPPPPPLAPAVPITDYFKGDEKEKAGQLATLLSTLPPEVKVDTKAPVSSQIESLEKQWQERFNEALQIARSVALPIEHEVGEIKPPVETPPVKRVQPSSSTGPRIVVFVIVAAIVGGLVVWLIPKHKQGVSVCALTSESYSSPQEQDFRCEKPYVKSLEYTDCSLETSQRGTITGHCQNSKPVGLWTSRDSNGTTVWSGNFDTGMWEVPSTYNGITVRATERRDGLTAQSRSFTLPSGASVTWSKGKGTSTRCGQASYSFIDESATYALNDGTKALVFNDSNVSFGANQLAKDLVDLDELKRQSMRFATDVEQCLPVQLVAPKCKAGSWDTGCQDPSGRPCFRHIDATKTVNFNRCDAAHERTGQTLPMSSAEKAANPYCSQITQCTAFTPVVHLHPVVKKILVGQHFPIGNCVAAKVKEPVKLASGSWQVKAACQCGALIELPDTPYLELALYAVESDLPDADTLKERFQRIGEKCGQ